VTQEITDLLQELATEGWILMQQALTEDLLERRLQASILRFVLPPAAPVPPAAGEDTLGRPQNLLSGLFVSPHLEDVNILHDRPKSK
jgi:hypothetical protein